MLHFVMSYMKQNKSRKQTLESAQYGLEVSFKAITCSFVQVQHSDWIIRLHDKMVLINVKTKIRASVYR